MSAPLLNFGRAPIGGRVGVDLDRLIASRALIQANSGGGKSRALRYLLEQTHGRVQQLIIDPEGEFATLRERFPYVLAGRDGDIPADPKTAKLLCRRLMEIGASAVLDISELRIEERRAFVRVFLDELMHLPRTLWHPTLIAIDEAHNYAPERGSGESQSTEAVIALATQGRKRGYCMVAATQRLSKLHKDVAAELLNKLIGRTGLDVDLKRAGDELGMDKEARATLRTLAPGTFYAYGPAIANEVTLVRTGDVATTHPEAGTLAAPPPPAPAAVEGLLAQLKDIPQAAAEELRAVEDYKQKVATLERDLRMIRGNRGEIQVEKVVEKTVPDFALVAQAVADHEKAGAARLREMRSIVESAIEELQLRGKLALDSATKLQAGLDRVGTTQWSVEVTVERARGRSESGGSGPARVESGALSAPAPRSAPTRFTPANDAAISGPMQRIVNALSELERLGVAPAPRPTAAGLVGYHMRAKSFVNALGSLRSQGMIDYPSPGTIALCQSGRDVATSDLRFSSLHELHQHWSERMSGPERKIVHHLVKYHPGSVDRELLAEWTDYHPRAKSFVNALGKLRTAGLIDYPNPGRVAVTDVLFPAGLV